MKRLQKATISRQLLQVAIKMPAALLLAFAVTMAPVDTDANRPWVQV